MTRPKPWYLKTGAGFDVCDAPRPPPDLSILQRRRVLDITDRVFHDLTARYPVARDDAHGIAWSCDCRCGRHDVRFASQLIAGTAKACSVCAAKRRGRRARQSAWRKSSLVERFRKTGSLY